MSVRINGAQHSECSDALPTERVTVDVLQNPKEVVQKSTVVFVGVHDVGRGTNHSRDAAYGSLKMFKFSKMSFFNCTSLLCALLASLTITVTLSKISFRFLTISDPPITEISLIAFSTCVVTSEYCKVLKFRTLCEKL